VQRTPIKRDDHAFDTVVPCQIALPGLEHGYAEENLRDTGFRSGTLDNPLSIALRYPPFRFMGSKHRLLPWLYEIFSSISFRIALDAFSGSGCVAYLLKAMGATVTANDYLRFAYHIANALVANLVITAMCRAALKRQPRGVFTVANGKAARYDDGRRDLRLTLQEHFIESMELFRSVPYDDGRPHRALCMDVFDLPVEYELVYLDPPYVPRSDDNCYIKRYHFVEGLACYWHGYEILASSKVRKIKKKYTPFSYRRTSIPAFDQLFRKFAESVIVLSYSSNGYPDLEVLISLLRRYKSRVEVFEAEHRYHYGTHDRVRPERALVREFLIIGT
jgi:16S rRNA G966 N2-methylase RsmD